MRNVALVLATALLLVGCGDDGPDATATSSTSAPPSTSTPATTGTTAPTQPEETEPEEAELTLVLEADGVGFLGADADGGIDSLEFGTARDDAVQGISAALGETVDEGVQEECPAGPATFASWAGGFSATFQEDRFVGWTLGGDAGLTTAGGLGTGSTLDELLAELPEGTVEETTLGTELVGADLSALLTGPDDTDTVDALWAGTTCTFR